MTRFFSLTTALSKQKLVMAAVNTARRWVRKGKPAANAEFNNRLALTAGASGMCDVECCALKKMEKEYSKRNKLAIHVPGEPTINDWAPMSAEDCAFRMDSEKTSAVLDLLHDRTRGLLPQPGSAVNEVEEEKGKGGLVEKLTFSPLDSETLGEESKISAPPIGKHEQS